MGLIPEWRLVADTETTRRAAAIKALVALLEPDPHSRPWFLSDEATAFEVLLETEEEIRTRLVAALGPKAAGARLNQPLWKLVDELSVLVPGWLPK